MDNREFKKRIRKDCLSPLAKKYGFSFTKPTLLTRVNDNVIQIINFDAPTQGLNCDIALQPLYVPDDVVVLSFGNRLNHFMVKLPGLWGYDRTEHGIKKDIHEIMKLIETNVIPWFNAMGNPDGIVSLIESGAVNDPYLTVGFSPFLRHAYLGFSYLYLGKFDLAEKPLKTVIDIFKDDDRIGAIRWKELMKETIVLIKNEPDKIHYKLDEYIQQTKANLKLK